MSFSKAKLKRFNDVDTAGCGSPARPNVGGEGNGVCGNWPTTACHSERRDQIEKFFKDAVRFASHSKDSKEPITSSKEDKKSKTLRLFRTPSLPHRLRFRQNQSEHSNQCPIEGKNNGTPAPSNSATPVKDTVLKMTGRIKGKDALQETIRRKDELIENYLKQIDVLKRHVEQLKETEGNLRKEHLGLQMKSEDIIHALTAEKTTLKEQNERLILEHGHVIENLKEMDESFQMAQMEHSTRINNLQAEIEKLEVQNRKLEALAAEHITFQETLRKEKDLLEQKVNNYNEQITSAQKEKQEHLQTIEELTEMNKVLQLETKEIRKQIDDDALAYAQELRVNRNEMECLKNERNTLKNDLSNKCDLIRALQEELLDKSCEIDVHCDTIRQLQEVIDKSKTYEEELAAAKDRLKQFEKETEEKVQKLEFELENSLERERSYWHGELEKRQKLAENDVIKVEMEKQDIMLLLENTNDMLHERNDRIQKYEDQLRNGIDYYVQLTDHLQKQVVEQKQEIAKLITEKYNYQLTLNNTRSTVNILMERLKKSDSDVEELKAELESLQLSKGVLEQSLIGLQGDLERARAELKDTEAALRALKLSSETLEKEVSIKEILFNEILLAEEEKMVEYIKLASPFQENVKNQCSHSNYGDISQVKKSKEDRRELYIQDMKKALDEFATVLQFAQLELDSKDTALLKLREECEQLRIENISLKSLKINCEESAPIANTVNKENSTDLEKIETLLIDTELRHECDKIASWLLNSSADKNIHNESANEIADLLYSTTPSAKSSVATATPEKGGNLVCNLSRTPKTPRTPKTVKNPVTPTVRITPKKTVLFPGKENVPSPQKQVLKPWNV